MKKLSQFIMFDFDAFAKDKGFLCTGTKPWTDHESGVLRGTKVEAVIVRDKTPYAPSKDGEAVTNLFEKIVFKVPSKISVPVSSEIVPVNPVATVYGEYHNQLSVTAESIKVVSK